MENTTFLTPATDTPPAGVSAPDAPTFDTPGVDPAPTTRPASAGRPRLRVRGLRRRVDGRTVLDWAGFDARAGEIVAIIGGSGAGKTTLLETVLGLRRAEEGTVVVDGVDVTGTPPAGTGVGYVPQDDIIHRDLPLIRTLRHAAALRLPAGTSPTEIDHAVADTLDRLGLSEVAEVLVRDLSGGQRKRASVAVELLDRPRLCFLDEPTSGLDPASSAELLGHLRHIADDGATVVLTTHAPADVERCDRVVFLAPGGRVAFEGSPAAARQHFEVRDLADAYAVVAASAPDAWVPAVDPPLAGELPSPVRPPHRPGWFRHWRTLARRDSEVMVRNRLTLAVLLGSPAMVIGMMALLFRPGGFETGGPVTAIQATYWIAFAGFFFGLTYGLLQIVGEMAIVRREHLAGVRASAYVAAKVAVLTPVLVAMGVSLLLVLRALDRLPAASVGTWVALGTSVVLVSLAALGTGLLASAAVTDATQATMALPMICFPQVLFAGALVAVPEMAVVGRAFSVVLVNRWAFESLGRSLDLDAMVSSSSGTEAYRDAFVGSPVVGWGVLAVATVLTLAGTVAVLGRRTRAQRP